ncbi:MAG TPA: hypothetical protein VMY38_02340 [Gemmatimonadaceae bacterium]|nr:hypothetical protein [Gemmatimonadaceae bacterium]
MIQRTKRVGRYAPISTGRPPLLTIASAYFMFSGVSIALSILIATLFMPDVLKGQLTPIQLGLSLATTVAWAGGMFWTGSLLADKSRRGAYYALGFIAFSLITSFDRSTLVFSVVSLAVLACIWKHLE